MTVCPQKIFPQDSLSPRQFIPKSVSPGDKLLFGINCRWRQTVWGPTFWGQIVLVPNLRPGNSMMMQAQK